jgi:hypothetical protein
MGCLVIHTRVAQDFDHSANAALSSLLLPLSQTHARVPTVLVPWQLQVRAERLIYMKFCGYYRDY